MFNSLCCLFNPVCHTHLFVSCGPLLKRHLGLFVQLLSHHSNHSILAPEKHHLGLFVQLQDHHSKHSILTPAAYKEGDKCCDHQVSTGCGLFWCNSLVWRGVIANATLLTIGSFVCNSMDPAYVPTPPSCIKEQEFFLKQHLTQPKRSY